MATPAQEAAAARARAALAEKREVTGSLGKAVDRLLVDIGVNRASGGQFDDRCVACLEKDRHVPGHTCPCACHEVRELRRAVR